MTVTLTGRLICATAAEAARVRAHLPDHIRLTRAEPGCLRFDVVATDDPLVWQVDETFIDQAAFDAHQARTQASRWARETAGIARDFTLTAPSA
jgi:quinol monooxygenase YgiN